MLKSSILRVCYWLLNITIQPILSHTSSLLCAFWEITIPIMSFPDLCIHMHLGRAPLWISMGSNLSNSYAIVKEEWNY